MLVPLTWNVLRTSYCVFCKQRCLFPCALFNASIIVGAWLLRRSSCDWMPCFRHVMGLDWWWNYCREWRFSLKWHASMQNANEWHMRMKISAPACCLFRCDNGEKGRWRGNWWRCCLRLQHVIFGYHTLAWMCLTHFLSGRLQSASRTLLALTSHFLNMSRLAAEP